MSSLLPKCTLGNSGAVQACIHSRHLVREPWELGCHGHVLVTKAEQSTLDSISSVGRVYMLQLIFYSTEFLFFLCLMFINIQ